MGYGEYLRELLRPLGVYRLDESSLSGAEIAALGEAMDALASSLREGLQNALPMSAEDAGLRRAESLFPFLPVRGSTEERRAALAGLWQVRDDGFSASALNRCLAACGMECTVEETGTPNHVRVRFPGVMGQPEQYGARKKIIEAILPCQLAVEYFFRYCTWEQTRQAGKTWADMASLTWDEWALTEAF